VASKIDEEPMRKEKSPSEMWADVAWHFKWLARFLFTFAAVYAVVVAALIADDMNWIDWK
jgi:hypothetical protein